MEASNNSAENIYIQSATLNGKPLNIPVITWEQLQAGGTLHFVMDQKPSEWGSKWKSNCMIDLPHQNVAAMSEPLDFEEWKKMVRNASDVELYRLQNIALISLRGDADNNPRWSAYVGVVENEMRERKIKP